MIFSLETQSIYTNGFQILCCHFKLKYLNQNFIYPTFEKKKKKPGLVRVCPGRPAGLPEFGRAIATTNFLLNPDHRVDPPDWTGFNNNAWSSKVQPANAIPFDQNKIKDREKSLNGLKIEA